MATTNFQIFNPGLSNAESDAAYVADPMRAGGAAAGSIFSSPLANKAFYQWSMMTAALAQMLVNKGYTVLDSDFTSLVAALANLKTGADFTSSLMSVAYSGSITFNAALSSGFEVTLTGNVAASTLSNVVAGQILTFVILQDAVGGRTFVWPSQISAPAICPTPNSVTIQQFEVLLGAASAVPLAPQMWVTSAGIGTQPCGNVVSVSTSGMCSSAYSTLTEKVNATSGAITRTLYNAVGFAGFTVNIIKNDSSANVVMILPQSGQTISGFANFSISKPFNAITLVSDGVGWCII